VCEDVVGDVGLNFTVALVSYWRNYGDGKGINSDRGHDLLVGVIQRCMSAARAKARATRHAGINNAVPELRHGTIYCTTFGCRTDRSR
jgi:hypothetical protein